MPRVKPREDTEPSAQNASRATELPPVVPVWAVPIRVQPDGAVKVSAVADDRPPPKHATSTSVFAVPVGLEIVIGVPGVCRSPLLNWRKPMATARHLLHLGQRSPAMPVNISVPSLIVETADALAAVAPFEALPGDVLILCIPGGTARWATVPEHVKGQMPAPDIVMDAASPLS